MADMLTKDEVKSLDLFKMLLELEDMDEDDLLDEVLGDDLDPKRCYDGHDKQALYAKTQGKCPYCGTKLEKGFHGDHVVPHSRGGRTTLLNGVGACPSCNLSKSNKVW